MTKEDYFKYYIQGSDHYLIPKDIFNELFDEMSNWKEEAKELKKQLDYLRSGEYYNQLRFENEMLQQVVDTNGVPSEVYDYIDCTHRNTELLKENQELKKENKELKKQVDEYKGSHYCSFIDICKSTKIANYNQQKEFIEWLEAMSKMYENEYKDIDIAGHYNCVLAKYKEIIGDDK